MIAAKVKAWGELAAIAWLVLAVAGCSLDWSERDAWRSDDLSMGDAGNGNATGAGQGGSTGAPDAAAPRGGTTPPGGGTAAPPQAGASGSAALMDAGGSAGSSGDAGCPDGFARDPQGGCADIDECEQPDRGGCSPDASCRNVEGGHVCTCEVGFEDTTGDGTACVHLCELAGCDADHGSCTLVAGEPKCACIAPYIGDGKSCAFDQACALLDCDPEHAECVMTGSDIRECRCRTGWSGNGEVCTNVDECEETPAICGANALCSDEQGSYDCNCVSGFEPAGSAAGCSNIDDCDPHPCGPGTCEDRVNGFECDCPLGYDGDRCEIRVPTCCPTGDCVCHGPDPTALTSSNGPYDTDNYNLAGYGCVYYPTDAEPPFAAVAVSDGYLGTGGCDATSQTRQWGPFYASHGIVTMIITTGSGDQPNVRSQKLLNGIAGLKLEQGNPSSPLFGKLAGRYGTSGFTMGGGASTIAAMADSTLRTNVALMPWGVATSGITVPTLIVCGSSDTTDPCSSHGRPAYDGISIDVPKMIVTITSGAVGGPSAGGGASARYALAFQKVFLENDLRWRPLLVAAPSDATTIQ